MKQYKKEESKVKRKHYSNKELTALGIFKEKKDLKVKELDEVSD